MDRAEAGRVFRTRPLTESACPFEVLSRPALGRRDPCPHLLVLLHRNWGGGQRPKHPECCEARASCWVLTVRAPLCSGTHWSLFSSPPAPPRASRSPSEARGVAQAPPRRLLLLLSAEDNPLPCYSRGSVVWGCVGEVCFPAL